MYHVFVGLLYLMENTIENKAQSQGHAFETARPFVSPSFAVAVLDCSKYQLLEQIENHRLPLAFDIGKPGSRRLCLRVAAASVRAVRTGLKPPSDLGKLLDTAFPKEQAHYKPSRLASLLDCDYDHIYHLLDAGALADSGDVNHYLIPRQSIIDFLGKRRLA
jgi:hypothetical protein